MQKLITLILFVLSFCQPALAKINEVDDANLLKSTLAATDGKTRIVLVVPWSEDEPETKTTRATGKGITLLNKAMKTLAKQGRKDVYAYLVNLHDTDYLSVLSTLPRFPKSPSAYPFFAIFKNGGVQGRLYGYFDEIAEILPNYITEVIDSYKSVPARWTLEASEIYLQYVYNRENCTKDVFNSEMEILKNTSKKLGTKYIVVEKSEKQPSFGGFTGQEVFETASYSIYDETKCHQVTAFYAWTDGNYSPSSLTISPDYSKRGDFKPNDFTPETIAQMVEKLKTGKY